MSFLAHDALSWIALLAAAFIQGLSKGGFPGATILAIPLVALVVPGKAATGLVLPMLIVGDLFALGLWRRSVSWRDLLKALPWALLGLALGALVLGKIDDAAMRPLVGVVVLCVLGVHLLKKRREARAASGETRPHPLFGIFMGLMGGLSTMLANAGGAIMSLYFLSLRISPASFLGTSAWFFFIVNLLKLPVMSGLGMISPQGLWTNLLMVPALALGVFTGRAVVKRIKAAAFELIILVLTALAALRLLVGA